MACPRPPALPKRRLNFRTKLERRVTCLKLLGDVNRIM